MKACNQCGIEKPETQFYLASSKSTKRRAVCMACVAAYSKSEKVRAKKRKRWHENKDELNAARRTDEHRKRSREQQKKRKAKINAHERKKRREDPVWRLRRCVSKDIARALKSNGSHKSMSFLKCVPYTMMKLKMHLENQFEPWMAWNNHGSYKADAWDDHNPSTWKWQVDHIIPQSDLPYKSMKSKNFKKCWALENLRPLSAKQNLLDGARKVRNKISR